MKKTTRGSKPMPQFEAFLLKIGKNLELARKKVKLTQAQVSDKTGIEYRYYQRMESGKVNMTLQTLFRLAQIFQTNVYLLIQGPMENKEHKESKDLNKTINTKKRKKP